MKKFYRKRSELVHGTGSAITDLDDVALTRIFQALIQKVLALAMDYAQMERQNDGTGVEDLIERLKFGVR